MESSDHGKEQDSESFLRRIIGTHDIEQDQAELMLKRLLLNRYEIQVLIPLFTQLNNGLPPNPRKAFGSLILDPVLIRNLIHVARSYREDLVDDRPIATRNQTKQDLIKLHARIRDFIDYLTNLSFDTKLVLAMEALVTEDKRATNDHEQEMHRSIMSDNSIFQTVFQNEDINLAMGYRDLAEFKAGSHVVSELNELAKFVEKLSQTELTNPKARIAPTPLELLIIRLSKDFEVFEHVYHVAFQIHIWASDGKSPNTDSYGRWSQADEAIKKVRTLHKQNWEN